MELHPYFCTKCCSRAEFCAQEGHFLHRKLWRRRFGARKSVFLHQMLLPAEFGAKMGTFLHRKLWRVGFRCQKGYLFAPFLVARRVRCQKKCFPAPKVAPRQSLVRRRGFFCTGSCREENTLQQLSGAEEVYGWEYECGTGKREYYRIGHRYAVGFEE